MEPSGEPIVFNVASSRKAGVCSVSGTDGVTVHHLAVGTCKITATQASDADFNAANPGHQGHQGHELNTHDSAATTDRRPVDQPPVVGVLGEG